jgi:hypothetical protein
VEDNGLTQAVHAREKENVETVDLTGRILKKKPCPAKGKKCESCGLFNHFSKCCRNSNAGSSSK